MLPLLGRGVESCQWATEAAPVCVLPAKMFPEIVANKSGSKVGVKYTAANGKAIYNEGSKTLVGKTKEGHKKKIEFEVADVNKPLASLRKIVKKGHRIVLKRTS